VTTVAWFHCFSGIAGDMALGAVLDAGADVDEVRTLLGRLPISGWRLQQETVQRGGITATRAVVTAPEEGQAERSLEDLEAIVDAGRLPDRVADRARRTFRRLAEVEAGIHGVGVDEIHFHEVGALDAVVDVVGTCAALEVLGIDEIHASPVAVGLGTVRAAHGVLPNPAPAVVALLRGAPAYGVDIELELTTPTGAALLATLASGWGAMPPLTIGAVGYGAGGRDLPHRPNVTQVVVGTAVTRRGASSGQPVVQLEANVDDATGEVLAHTVARLLDAGAHDAWVTPIVMKKGRPAHTVHALCDPAVADEVGRLLISETGSLGFRAHRIERWPQGRDVQVVVVDGEPVRVKVAAGRVKAEHDDAAAAARRLGLPLREVLARAEAAGAAVGAEPNVPGSTSEGSTS
jgi:uncharacterized protein (TIGR00299 family) protein